MFANRLKQCSRPASLAPFKVLNSLKRWLLRVVTSVNEIVLLKVLHGTLVVVFP